MNYDVKALPKWLNRTKLSKAIVVMSLVIFLIPAILWQAYQRERAQDDLGRVTQSRITQNALRHISQLQRVHLQLYVLIGRTDRLSTEAERRLQIELLWSALETIESPLYQELLSPGIIQLIREYHALWEEMQPLITRWHADPTDPTTRATLMPAMERSEQLIFSLHVAAQTEVDTRLIASGQDQQRLNRLIQAIAWIFMGLIITVIFLIYYLIQAQFTANQVLQHSEQRLRSLVETIPDLVCRLTNRGVYVDVKPPRNFELPFAVGELIGHTLHQRLPQELADNILKKIEDSLLAHQEQLYEFTHFHQKLNQLRDYEIRVVPSSVDEVLIIGRDITVEKQRAAQAYHAQKMESLGILAGGIAHDFNNLLTGMMGQISLVRMKAQKGLPLLDNIDKASKSAESAADLTKQLLAYAGKGQVQRLPLHLNEIVQDTVDLLYTVLPIQAELQLQLAPHLPPFEADRSQIQQMVMNLLINAVESLKEQAGKIVITTRAQQVIDWGHDQYSANHLVTGPYIALQIADNGVGIESANLSRIFEPFFTTKTNGHGLGLSALIGIIGAHHGGVSVQSQPGVGTVFTIFFTALPTPLLPKPEPQPFVPLDAKHQKSILVIDDEDDVRNAAYEILDAHGYHVLLANSGPQGIQLFTQAPRAIDLVLLDVRMPGMDGKQVFAKLRQIDPTANIAFVSGYSETELNVQLEGRQAVAFLPKPYTLAQLIGLVQTMTS